MNCIACHTAPPILNQFGQRFLEIGYQLLGTEDGGIIGKKKQCEVTIDYVTNYSGFRIVGNAIRSWGVSRSRTLQALTPRLSKTRRISRFLKNFVLFAGRTMAKNVGFMVELGHDVEGGDATVGQGFVTFNNIGYHDLAHL